MLESAPMDLIRDVADWIASETINFAATYFPLLMLGLVGLYLLWLVIGYLRVSQVGVHEAHEAREVVALPRPAEAAEPAALETAEEPARLEAEPGLPYCAVDGLQYPAGARYCTQCERDLVLDCTSCGATVNAAETSCYRCGTPTATAEHARTH
jgi:hypothetical protein